MRAPRRWALRGVAATSLVAIGCAAGEPPPAIPAATAKTAAPPEIPAESKVGSVARAKVYDATGNGGSCAPPLPDCPPLPVERVFLDRCRLAGFQVRQCGCAARCTGDVSAMGRRWGASGAQKECAPAKADCTPPPASAAFQDACTEKGNRLEVCGCEWLCTGNPTK